MIDYTIDSTYFNLDLIPNSKCTVIEYYFNNIILIKKRMYYTGRGIDCEVITRFGINRATGNKFYGINIFKRYK